MPEEPTPEDLSLSAKLSNYQEQGDVPRSVDLMLRFGARSIKFGLSCEKLQDSINRIADIYGHYLITLCQFDSSDWKNLRRVHVLAQLSHFWPSPAAFLK